MTSQGKEQFKKYDCSSEMKYKYTAAKIDELGKMLRIITQLRCYEELCLEMSKKQLVCYPF